MSGGKFRRLLSAGAAHAFPKRNGFARIVTGARHVEQAHLVRFQLVFAAERQKHSVLRSGANGRHDGLALLRVHVAQRELRAGH